MARRISRSGGARRATPTHSCGTCTSEADVLDQLTRPARFVTRVLHANVSRPARPWKLNVAFTYWCHDRCETFNIWRRKPADELTTSELVSFIRQNGGVSWVDLTGG